MQISSINNTNFKGLFTDKTAYNGGEWKMEYQPYSWELKKANKEHLDIFASYLPDNEEIYTKRGGFEKSEDILGTVSYYKHYENGIDVKRSTIDDLPSLNLEESLKVQDEKLDKFLKLKQDKMLEIKSEAAKSTRDLAYVSQEHERYANDIGELIGLHSYNKIDRENGVRSNFHKVEIMVKQLREKFTDYTKLAESANAIRKIKEQGLKELAEIEKAKLTDSYIDISRRDIKNPNGPLISALNNIEKAKNKLVALSYRTISMDEILRHLDGNFQADKIIKFVEELIEKRNLIKHI